MSTPRPMLAVEVLVVAFTDTILDLVHLDDERPVYTLGEQPGVDLVVDGASLPEPERHELVEAWGDQGFCVALAPGMSARILANGEQREVDTDTQARTLELRPGEQIWLTLPNTTLRLRARMVERGQLALERRPRDRLWVASLTSTSLLALVGLVLILLQAPRLVEIAAEPEDWARFVSVCPEPEPMVEVEQSEDEPSAEPERLDGPRAPGPQTGPELEAEQPEIHDEGRRGGAPVWAPVSASQAVGRYARHYDPVEAARHAGILGVLGDRSFLASDAPAFSLALDDDGPIWSPPELSSAYGVGGLGLVGSTGDSSSGAGLYGLLGSTRYDDRDSLHGEGIVGWGSYAAHPTLGRLRERNGDRAEAALCEGDCRRRRSPTVRPPVVVRIGHLAYVTGDLPRDVARRVIRAHRTRLLRCFETELPKIRRTIGLQVTVAINPQGKTYSTFIEHATVHDGGFQQCVTEVAESWTFPASTLTTTTAINVPLVFNP